MTKAQEIAWLSKAIADLGPHSYLGSTLCDQFDAIVADITNDVSPLRFADLRKTEHEWMDRIKAKEEEGRKLMARCEALEEKLSTAEFKLQQVNHQYESQLVRLRCEARDSLRELQALATV